MGADLLETIPSAQLGSFDLRNESPTTAFEIWQTNGQIEFYFHTSTDRLANSLTNQIRDKYPGVQIDSQDQTLPQFERSDYIAGAHLELTRPFWFPIKAPGQPPGFNADPFGPLTSELLTTPSDHAVSETGTTDSCQVIVQVAFRPARRSWSKGGWFGTDCETKADSLRQGKVKGGLLREVMGRVKIQDPSKQVRKTADIVENQRGDRGFYTDIRVFVVSSEESLAQEQLEHICDRFDIYYNSVTEQGFDPAPCRSSELETFAKDVTSRSFSLSLRDQIRSSQTLLTLSELTGLVHLPNESINTPDVDWARANVGPGVPVNAPEFSLPASGLPKRDYAISVSHHETKFDEQLIARGETADGVEETFAGPAARNRIEIPAVNPDSPIWMGTGVRSGRGASIDQEHLKRHMAVFGPTGYGKSTTLLNTLQQLIEGGNGCCFIDPKGDDSKALLERIPDHRLDDVVWVEPGASGEFVSGLNYLDAGVDSSDPLYNTAIDVLVENLKDLLDADDCWNPALDRAVTAVVDAMNQSESDFTLVDLYKVFSKKRHREEFVNLLRSEGVDAGSVASAIEIVENGRAGFLLQCLQSWMDDSTARRAIAFRESEVNIQQAIEDDAIIIVRMAAENTEQKEMIGTAVLQRIWAALRTRSEVSKGDRETFYLVVDEADNVVTDVELMTSMLSEVRSYGGSITLCTQDPTTLPDGVLNSVTTNCDTILSFCPGGAEQSRLLADELGMDWEALQQTSNYHIWMQVTLPEKMQKSRPFQVYTFPPYPPLRSKQQAAEVLEDRLRACGAKKSEGSLSAASVEQSKQSVLEQSANETAHHTD